MLSDFLAFSLSFLSVTFLFTLLLASPILIFYLIPLPILLKSHLHNLSARSLIFLSKPFRLIDMKACRLAYYLRSSSPLCYNCYRERNLPLPDVARYSSYIYDPSLHNLFSCYGKHCRCACRTKLASLPTNQRYSPTFYPSSSSWNTRNPQSNRSSYLP